MLRSCCTTTDASGHVPIWWVCLGAYRVPEGLEPAGHVVDRAEVHLVPARAQNQRLSMGGEKEEKGGSSVSTEMKRQRGGWGGREGGCGWYVRSP